MGTAILGGIRPRWRRSQSSRYARKGVVGLVVVEVVYSRIPRGGVLSPNVDMQEVISSGVEMKLEIIRGER